MQTPSSAMHCIVYTRRQPTSTTNNAMLIIHKHRQQKRVPPAPANYSEERVDPPRDVTQRGQLERDSAVFRTRPAHSLWSVSGREVRSN